MPYKLHTIGKREELRATFDQVAQQYDENRPSYPPVVFDDIVLISGVTTESHLLEIGCGTGHATQVFASRGLHIHALEMGDNMADLARPRLASFPHVAIEIADFDRWTNATRYHLVYAATSFHWLNPATREQQIASLLHPRGWFAMWRNRHIRNGSSDGFLDAAQPIYNSIAPELVQHRATLPGPHDVVEAEREKLRSGLFEEPVTRVYYWSKGYSAVEYVAMLNTHSDHQLLPPERRSQLFNQLSELITERYGGSVTKDYATVLQMARLRG
ncbi:MAG: class I SAM-dependent methyltransferase [Terracidiphilus sp.]